MIFSVKQPIQWNDLFSGKTYLRVSILEIATSYNRYFTVPFHRICTIPMKSTSISKTSRLIGEGGSFALIRFSHCTSKSNLSCGTQSGTSTCLTSDVQNVTPTPRIKAKYNPLGESLPSQPRVSFTLCLGAFSPRLIFRYK